MPTSPGPEAGRTGEGARTPSRPAAPEHPAFSGGRHGVPGRGQGPDGQGQQAVGSTAPRPREGRDISIGTYPAVTLSEARERAHDNRLTAKRGGDPSGRASTVPTFADLSAKVDQGGQWRGRTRETRRRTPARYAARLMGRPVDQIDRAAGHVDVNAAGEVIDAALSKTPKTRAHRRALP